MNQVKLFFWGEMKQKHTGNEYQIGDSMLEVYNANKDTDNEYIKIISEEISKSRFHEIDALEDIIKENTTLQAK